MTTFNLPDLGEGLTEATLLSWLVAEGETIVVDQPIAEVETAKSAIEVPSPYAGVVTTLHGAVGETMIVDQPLITVGGEDAGDAGDSRDSAASGVSGALSYREEERAGTVPATGSVSAPDEPGEDEGSGNVLIGYGTSTSSNSRRRRRRNGAGRQTNNGGSGETAQGHSAAPPAQQRAPRVSSPLVRRLAREHSVSLGELSGSGPDGMILRADVQAAINASSKQESPATADPSQTTRDSAAPARTATSSKSAPGSTKAPAPGGLEVRERVPMSGMRTAVATTLSRSRREIPEATVWQDVDVTEVLALRARLKEQAAKNGVAAPSLLALLSRFLLAGLARYPDLATRLEVGEDGSQEIVHFDGINLGFAAQTPAGLVVPVIRHAERLSARGLHTEIERLVREAREGSISGR